MKLGILNFTLRKLLEFEKDLENENQDSIHYLDGKKLRIAKDWPIKAFISREEMLFSLD